MKLAKYIIPLTAFLMLVVFAACEEKLDEPAENKTFTKEIDYTQSQDMILPLIGLYSEFQNFAWENFPLIAVRGDDVNAGGLGDQQDYTETDKFNYNKDYWMYNSVWQNLYRYVFTAHTTINQIKLYFDAGADAAKASQYTAEAQTIRAWALFQLSRLWGNVFIPESEDPSKMLVATPATKDMVMQHISDQMDLAIPNLPAVHPSERTDVKGGITKFTALAIKALANLELREYQKVADATSQIISSGKFDLMDDYYNLFKIPGKLSNENIFEMQYSDFGSGSGDVKSYLYAFFGPAGWTPKIQGAGDGWGFYEPSLKYIKFMIDRGETVRLETSVLFSPRGIAKIKEDPKYASLPSWISNTTRSGDRINDYARAMFASGKHYLPSDQLTPGRTDYGTNKNFTCIRYSEILLMHAEALTRGATSQAMTAVAAINEVRSRAGLSTLQSVTSDQVMDEKFAELGMEWGTRFYDMVRLGKTNELSYDGRTFTDAKTFLPYPQNQVDQLPVLKGK